MKEHGQTITMERDDRDFLMDLGRRQGVSRILGASSMAHLVEQFRPPMQDCLHLPWEDTHGTVRFAPGKVTVWSGPTFAGKTSLLRQTMMHAAALTNRRVLFISLEEEPDEVWREFTCMAAHTRNPSRDAREAAQKLFDNRIWVFDSTEMVEPTILFGIIRFAVERFGFSQIVIDSLMRLALRIDDYEGQREMGNTLGRLSKITKTHIHLVAHPRKTANSRESMDLYDIRGAQDIVAQADSVLTLERTHKGIKGEPTNMLTVWKQRGEINWSGKIPLHYCVQSRQLMLRPYDQPYRYLPESVYGTPPPRRDEWDPFPEEAA
jgi:twinkle protein